MAFIGQIILWPAKWIPEGWMHCDGRQLDIQQYQALYTVLEDQFTEESEKKSNKIFRLPDLRCRVPICTNETEFGFPKDMGVRRHYPIGETGGTETEILSVSHIPGHIHDLTLSKSLTAKLKIAKDAATDATPAADMLLAAPNTTANDGAGLPGVVNIYGRAASASNQVELTNAVSIDFADAGKSVSTNVTGGGQAHNNLQPYIVMNYIICVSGEYPIRS